MAEIFKNGPVQGMCHTFSLAGFCFCPSVSLWVCQSSSLYVSVHQSIFIYILTFLSVSSSARCPTILIPYNFALTSL